MQTLGAKDAMNLAAAAPPAAEAERRSPSIPPMRPARAIGDSIQIVPLTKPHGHGPCQPAIHFHVL